MSLELEQLKILIELPGSKLSFNDKDEQHVINAMFNPNKLTVNRSAQWQNQQTPKRDNPELQYTGAEPSTLSVELFFDTYDTDKPNDNKESVRIYTNRLHELTTVKQHGDKHRPPCLPPRLGKDECLFPGRSATTPEPVHAFSGKWHTSASDFNMHVQAMAIQSKGSPGSEPDVCRTSPRYGR